MLGARPKKMMNMYILDILKKNTDAAHPITQKEIQQRLEREYDMTVDRKAVKANLEDLINDGSYNIEYATKVRLTPNRQTGEIEKNEVLTGFYYNSVFADSEIRLLMDSVLFSKSIPTNNKKQILSKLKGLSNKYFKFNIGNIQSFESTDREMNKELFYTIEILDTPRKPKNEVEGLMGLDIVQYMNEHIYMFGGKSIRAQFEMPKYLISDVLDHFKADVNFKQLDENTVLTSVKVNENDMRLWAKQYCGQVKITEPKDLAQICRQDIVDALKIYEN